ncbi:uncharacterized protein BP5553_05378 [Venustampulla echinocandica]|uniref:FCP1 homology domain-containing protein n=1 Tax=Venustampulla echinocandica TaxID=2656787 RepID=A0A370TQY5_9HELO|nr:uncharacterized protein BP5553_05378 [Venustampulla echinocandica]RDL37945.1 hypothetical protein BP5553_05378 [Venustampulla echinocandica]
MNSLNILSARVSPPQTPAPSRSNSYGNLLPAAVSVSEQQRRSREELANANEGAEGEADDDHDHDQEHDHDADFHDDGTLHEEAFLSEKVEDEDSAAVPLGWHMIPKRISTAFIESIRWVLSALAAPGVYLIAYLYDETGNFAPLSQLRKLGMAFYGETGRASTNRTGDLSSRDEKRALLGDQKKGKSSNGRRGSSKASRAASPAYSSSGVSSESESDRATVGSDMSASAGSNRHARSKSLQPSDEIAPARRSIRIKLHNEDTLRQRKHRRAQSTNSRGDGSGRLSSEESALAAIKSPTSPSASMLMTKYPRAPAPPRPLIPPRQPSWSLADAASGRHVQKTLILDLDETLIHSMAKGGRMSTGHMVEVKLNTVVGAGGNTTMGPQHPILYYVHKRPYCDDFLRRVCKWYNLVVFTASVQEYADPVIDWLEQERKFFSGRYYRQHCTFRHGAFIKDLSSVQADLSKVMILDNSPLSYMFHQGKDVPLRFLAAEPNSEVDNAIPIEGWINDPTDNDLLHLVPLLEGLQWVTDVRAFLGLRGGEDGKQ